MKKNINEVKLFSTRIPEEQITALKIKAATEKTTVQELVNSAITKLLSDQGPDQ